MSTSPYFDNDEATRLTMMDRMYHTPKHRRRTTISDSMRWRSELPTDPRSLVTDSEYAPPKHRAGRHERRRSGAGKWIVTTKDRVGTFDALSDRRLTPANVCTGQHCLGRHLAILHRGAVLPYHR